MSLIEHRRGLMQAFHAASRHSPKTRWYELRNILKRYFSVDAMTSSRIYPKDFEFLSNFLSLEEQRVLLSAALEKLNQSERRSVRRRRRRYLSSLSDKRKNTGPILEEFLPDEYYEFEEGHFDGVIKRFREIHVSSWDGVESPILSKILDRLRTLYPSPADTQNHILHLASDGSIYPHVDNMDASGSWILGVSLGADRVLDMQSIEGAPQTSFQALLPSGSVYIQKDNVRYKYNHSVLRPKTFMGRDLLAGQRISLMIRDRKPLS